MIDGEIAAAEKGEPAYIGLKLNSLTDKKLMDKLVEASQAGVKIQMVIRGICCLVAGVKGYTENIEIISIVGRYLEHARIYIFGVGDGQRVYISSADFMTRNTLRRIEVAAPVYDQHIKNIVVRIFQTMLSDNIKARDMLPDGTYKRRVPNGNPMNSQEYFISEAKANARAAELAAEYSNDKQSIISKAKTMLPKIKNKSGKGKIER
jgi:polyphosphate kinase